MVSLAPPGPLLQLTFFFAFLAELFSGSILEWLVESTAQWTQVAELKNHEAMLMLNLSGALVDGVRDLPPPFLDRVRSVPSVR